MADKPLDFGEKRARFSHGITLLVLSITLATTWVSWHSAQEDLRREVQTYFDFRVRQLLENIHQRLETYQNVLYGARGLFIASDRVSRSEFRDYVEALHLDLRYPGIQGVGFSVLIPAKDKQKHLEEIRKQGFPAYRIYPEGERDPYSAIVYLEPFKERNLRAFGYDMYSEPVRNRAMAYARDHNQIGMSGKVKLVQETDQDIQAGFLIYLPLYKNGVPHPTEQERQKNLLGWVYSPFRIKDFIQGVGGERSGDLYLAIYDGETLDQDSLMYQETAVVDANHDLVSVQKFTIGGHSWSIKVQTSADFYARINRDKPKIILAGGVLASLLLTLLTWQLIHRRRQALQLAQKMTQELQESEARFRLMADSAPVLIWVAGTDKLCFWFNKVWLDFTGRSLEQEMGNGWAEGVHADDFARCLGVYVSHFDRRQPFSMEYRLRRHDGEYRWLLDTGIPRFDNEGEFAGYIGSCIDITEPKAARNALEGRNADLTRFAEVSAHHLMEPTRRFISYTQQLHKHLSSYPDISRDAEVVNDLRVLERDALWLRALILDIQRYLAAGQPFGEIARLDSRALVLQLCSKWAVRCQAQGAEIQVDDLPKATLDRSRFNELFSVLLDNALRHGAPTEPGKRFLIQVQGERQGNISRFYIKDNGPGIPQKYRARVFEIFERLQPRTEQSGTGIGLAIARRIVESRGGNISFKDSEQGGTCVVFELPDRDNGDIIL